MNARQIPFLALMLAPLMAGPAMAGEFAGRAQADLLPGWRDGAAGTHVAALRIRLAPGWKTYWRAPGEAGIPPRFDWQGSDNLASVRIHWPVPHVFEQGGMRAIGYRDQVVVPITFVPRDPSAPIALVGRVDIGVCDDICIPLGLRLVADLGTAHTAPDPAIIAALNDRPATPAEAGLRKITCTAVPIDGGLRLSASIDMPPMGGDEASVIELADPSVWVADTDTTRQGDALLAVADIYPATTPFLLNRSELRITVFGAQGAVDIRGCEGG